MKFIVDVVLRWDSLGAIGKIPFRFSIPCEANQKTVSIYFFSYWRGFLTSLLTVESIVIDSIVKIEGVEEKND